MNALWLTQGTLITPQGVVDGALHLVDGRIVAIRPRAPRGARVINVRGAFVAPGFIDLHVWGEPERLARELPAHGTTAFLTTLGPRSPTKLLDGVRRIGDSACVPSGARCLGIHLEGPFLSRTRAGVLPKRWMRPPSIAELGRLARAGSIRLITLAPELQAALPAIRWCHQRRIVVSLGHSDADAATALRAVEAGATAVTHVFNGMRPFHHRAPSVVDVALTDPRLTTMAILDGVHMSPLAFRLLVKAKGPSRVALVTDSIKHQGWDVIQRAGAFYTRRGVLAGSGLTMMQAVRNAVRFGGVALVDAVRMGTEVPARLLGDRSRGALEVGRRADLVAFDERFRVVLTMVGGRVIYEQGG